MANEIFLTKNEKFHVFSKSPITPTMGLGQAVNKSGHTTTTSDVWSQDIPWFFSADDQATALVTGKDAKYNDLVLIGSAVYKRNETEYSEDAAFDELWESFNLEDGTKLYNSIDKTPVLVYHKGVPVSFLTPDNNAKQASNYAGRIFINNKVVDQFVVSTDKISGGVPSTGYGISVYKSGEPLSEGETEKNFIANSYAGIIQFNTKVGPSTEYTADVFEYIGEKLGTSIENIKRDIESIGTTSGDGVKAATKAAEDAGISITSITTDNGESVRAIDISTAELNTGNSFQDGDINKKKLVTAETEETFVQTYVSENTVSSIDVSVDGGDTKSVNTINFSGATGNDVTVAISSKESEENVSDLEISATLSKAVLTTDNSSFTEDSKDKVVSGTDVLTLIDTKIAKAHEFGVTYSVVDDLPEESSLTSSDVGTIYLVPEVDGSALSGGYVEWMAIEKDGVISLENIGTTKADISEYEGRITQNETDIGNLESEISTINKVNSQLSAAIYENFLHNTVFNINRLYPEVGETFANTTYGEPGNYPEGYDTYANGEKIWDDLGPVNYIRKYFFDLDSKFGLSPNGVSGADTTWTYDRDTTLANLKSALDGTLDMSNYEMIPRLFIENLYEKLKVEGATPTIEDTLSHKMMQAGLTIKYYRSHSADSSTNAKIYDKQGYWTTLVFRGNKMNQIASYGPDNNGINWSWQNGPTGIGWRIPRWDAFCHPSGYWDRTITRNDFYIHENDLDFDANGNKTNRTTKLHVTQEEKDKWNNSTQKISGYTSDGASVEKEVSSIKIVDGRGDNVNSQDLWGTKVSIDDTTGTVTVDHKFIEWKVGGGGIPLNKNIKSVENNKAYLDDEKTQYINIETERIKMAHGMFYSTTLSSFSSDLSSLEDSTWMFDSSTIKEWIDVDMPNLKTANGMFGNSQLTSFKGDMPNLKNGEGMFAHANLTSFEGNLDSLINGAGMFTQQKSTSFSFKTNRLDNLQNGNQMFYGTTLSQFDYDLPNLIDGVNMFGQTMLVNFKVNMPNLTNGEKMFETCSALESFECDLSSLTDGTRMFYDCTKLTSFVGDLSSLFKGKLMFNHAALDEESVVIISESINDLSDLNSDEFDIANEGEGVITIGIGSNPLTTTYDEAFKKMTKEKGWIVTVTSTYNADVTYNPTVLDETLENQNTPLPFYAKPLEADETKATYIGEDGKFYNVIGGNYIYGDDISTYGLFGSYEDAIANMRLKPYVKED